MSKLYEDENLYYNIVYRGGLSAVQFILDNKIDQNAMDSIIKMTKLVESKDDWELAFLEWSNYPDMNSFYNSFDEWIDSQTN